MKTKHTFIICMFEKLPSETCASLSHPSIVHFRMILLRIQFPVFGWYIYTPHVPSHEKNSLLSTPSQICVCVFTTHFVTYMLKNYQVWTSWWLDLGRLC